MRRKEFNVLDRERIEEVLKKVETGYLAFNGPDGWPRITALSYVYDGRILWHGAAGGERFECLNKDPRATFAVVSVQRYVPSHFLSQETACRAGMIYKSVIVRGECRFIDDPGERCRVLNQLMEKYQPEGRYEKLSPDNPLYEKTLRMTAICALKIENWSAKFRLDQHRSEEDRKKMAAGLKERGSEIDRIAAEEILKTTSV